MAGFSTKLNSYMYEGELTNGGTDPIENGTIVSIEKVTGDPALVMKPATSTTQYFLCKEKTEIYDGVEAYRFVVVGNISNMYIVENQTEYNDSCEYDARYWKTPVGEFLRAHPLQHGDEFVVTTTSAKTVGTKYGVTAGIIA